MYIIFRILGKILGLISGPCVATESYRRNNLLQAKDIHIRKIRPTEGFSPSFYNENFQTYSTVDGILQ